MNNFNNKFIIDYLNKHKMLGLSLFISAILYGILFYLISLLFVYVTVGYDKISVYLSRTGMVAWTLIALIPNLILAIIILIKGLFISVFVLTISILMAIYMYANVAIKFVYKNKK